MIIVDASYAGSWFLPDEASVTAEKTLKSVLSGKEEMAAPDLWTYEMLNLLLTASRRKRIREDQLAPGVRLLQSIPCTYYDHRTLLAGNRTLSFSVRFSLSVYDACYLELADRLQCRLCTLDKTLSEAARSLGLR